MAMFGSEHKTFEPLGTPKRTSSGLRQRGVRALFIVSLNSTLRLPPVAGQGSPGFACHRRTQHDYDIS